MKECGLWKEKIAPRPASSLKLTLFLLIIFLGSMISLLRTNAYWKQSVYALEKKKDIKDERLFFLHVMPGFCTACSLLDKCKTWFVVQSVAFVSR